MPCCSLVAAQNRDAQNVSEFQAHLTIFSLKPRNAIDNTREPERRAKGFVVAGEDLPAAVKCLHEEFFRELDPAVFDA